MCQPYANLYPFHKTCPLVIPAEFANWIDNVVRTLLESNQAYVDDKSNPGELGFGTCLGYQDDTFLYLHSELCHKVVRKFCEEQGENFSCTHKSLLKAMAEEGLILPGTTQNTRPLRVGSKQKRVIFLYREKAERIRDAAL